MAEPWFKFFPTDWRADPALKMCSLAARGLWIEMLGIMHDAAQYGHLLVANRPPSDADLAMLIGSAPEQVSELIGELESRAVFSRTRKGVIYSRKMVRDAKKAETARKNGKKGGNPTLSKQRKVSPSDNLSDMVGDKPQKPEARSQTVDDDDRARDETFLERICIAAGRPLGTANAAGRVYLPNEATRDLIQQWKSDLNLTEAQIVAEVDRQTKSRGGQPPQSLSYFTEGLKQLAGELRNRARTPLTPIDGGYNAQGQSARTDHRAAAADDALRQRIEAATRNRSPSKRGICFD